MPLREYLCSEGHLIETLTPMEGYDKEIECPRCTKPSKVIPSRTSFFLSWSPAPLNAKECWAGTPLEGTDGINPLRYKSEKPFVDMA